MKRLFAAIKILPDQDFLAEYRNLKIKLRHEQIKWVEDQNIHITLKFFGETEEHRLDAIHTVLRQRASTTPALVLRLNKLGIFGSSYAPKVIWVGIEPYATLALLMQNLHNDLKLIGFDPDRQNPVPHLTLGRIRFLKDKQLFQRTVEEYSNMASSVFPVSEIILFESILRREGPLYIALERYPLYKKELP